MHPNNTYSNVHSTDYKAALSAEVVITLDSSKGVHVKFCLICFCLAPESQAKTRDKQGTRSTPLGFTVFGLWVKTIGCQVMFLCSVCMWQRLKQSCHWPENMNFLMVNVQTQRVSPSFPATSLLLSHNTQTCSIKYYRLQNPPAWKWENVAGNNLVSKVKNYFMIRSLEL